jgi:hypothetical protein
MERFNPAKAFEQVRAESRRKEEAAAEAGRRKHGEWAAYGRRSAALNRLLNLFPRDDSAGCAVDVPEATALMVEYAQTLPAEWVKARVESVSERMAELAADGKPVEDAALKEILLNLLLHAGAGDRAKVAETFSEAVRGDANGVKAFRLCLVNWLADKIVDTWPPLPDELKQAAEALAGAEPAPPPDSEPQGGRPARRTGRPRKGESDKERLVIGALVKHHRYQPGGGIGDYTPAKTKRLAGLASGKDVKVSVATVSRFFKKKFPVLGYKGYEAACNRDAKVNIGMYLALWQGDVAERLADLLPHESGREDDKD